MSWNIVDQLLVAASVETTKRYNPKPTEVIRAGSASHLTLVFLQSRPGRYYTAGQIIAATGQTSKAVAWGLLYLRRLGLIDAIADTARIDRYLRYKAREGTAHQIMAAPCDRS
jgi:hypothetical protein